MFKSFSILVLLLIAPFAGMACRSKEQPQPDVMGEAPTNLPANSVRPQTHWDEKPLPVSQKPVAVAEGPSPLVHIFDIGGPIRVVDLTTNTPLANAVVPDRTLVRVDDRNGVTIGMQNILPGPLSPGHRYGIFADPTTPNVVRTGVGPPGDVPR